MTLTIIANITAKAEHRDRIRAALLDLIEPTRVEEGCQRYELFEDNEDPNHFMFHECWESPALWQKHRTAPGFVAHFGAIKGGFAALTVCQMHAIG